MTRPVHVLQLGHARAKAAVASGAPVFLGVNPVEYHGPHLSLHNDRLVTEAIAGLAHGVWSQTHDWPFLTAGDLEIGVDPTPGPGTRDTPYTEARRVIVRACEALADLGARRVVLGTFHGAPLHSAAVDAGLRALRKRGVPAFAPMHILLGRLSNLEPDDFPGAFEPVANDDEREAVQGWFVHDMHAGFLETSLTLALAPDGVSGHEDVPPCPAVTPARAMLAMSRGAARVGRARLSRELRTAAFAAGWFRLDPFPGYTSLPHVANEESGRRLIAREMDDLIALGLRVLHDEEAHPRAPMGWVSKATIGGRVGDVRAPADR